MPKAISAIIGSILILLITITLGVTSYLYISGTLTGKLSTAFEVLNAYGDTITIVNSGTNPITSFTKLTVDDTPADYLVSVQDDSLVGYWKMDELNRTIADDSSGKGNTGTFNGEVFNDGTINGAAFASGQYGNGLQFDGVDDYVNVGNGEALKVQNFTITMWIFDKGAPDEGLVGVTGSNNFGFKIYSTNPSSQYNFLVGNGTGFDVSVGPQLFGLTNKWTHAAISWDATNKSYDVYVDGALQNHRSLNLKGTAPNWNAFSELDIGMASGCCNYALNGTIDEVKIYNRTLSQSEIQDDMNSTYPVNRTVAWYNFDNDAIDRHNIVKGKYGAGKAFDGLNDLIVVVHNNTLDFDNSTSFSLNFWLKFDILRRQFVFDTRDAVADGWAIETSSSGTISLGGRDDDSTVLPANGVSITDLNWHFYSFVLERGVGLQIYKDGVLGNGPVSLTGIDNFTETSNFTMGDVSGGGFPCVCLLDSVAIYRRALSADEIKANYNIGSQINAGKVASIKIYNQLSKGTHTVKICTSSMCNIAILTIN